MMTPSSVRNARILCRVSAGRGDAEELRDRHDGCGPLPSSLSPSFSTITLSPSLIWRSTLNGPVTIWSPTFGAGLDLDHQLAGDARSRPSRIRACRPGRSRRPLPSRRCRPKTSSRPVAPFTPLRLLRNVAHDEGLDRNGRRAFLAARHDLGGDGEARPNRVRRVLQPDLDLEVDRLGVGGQREQVGIVLRDRRGADFGDTSP